MNYNENDNERTIVLHNLISDIKELFYSNFVTSVKGYIPIFCLLMYKISHRLPYRKYIRNNNFIPIKFCEKNYILDVKPIRNSIIQNVNDENINPEINLKHIPSFSFLNNKTKSKEQSIEKEDYIKIKLAGLDYINKEGFILINNIFHRNSKNHNFFLQLNNLEYPNTNETLADPKVYGWLIMKKKFIPFSRAININILLAKKGYCKIKNVEGVYDEKIYFYMNDMIEAEKEAQLKGIGIWRNQKSHIISDYTNQSNLFSKIQNFFSPKSKWRNILLRKNFE